MCGIIYELIIPYLARDQGERDHPIFFCKEILQHVVQNNFLDKFHFGAQRNFGWIHYFGVSRNFGEIEVADLWQIGALGQLPVMCQLSFPFPVIKKSICFNCSSQDITTTLARTLNKKSILKCKMTFPNII